MLKKLFDQKRLVCYLIVVGLWLWLFPIWSEWASENPLKEENITLSPAGSFSKEIEIRIPENYHLWLGLNNPHLSHEENEKLIGSTVYQNGKANPSGINVPIHWDLKDIKTGTTVKTAETDTYGYEGYGRTFHRHVGYFRVNPGRYLFTARILHDVPELSGFNSTISTGSYGKSWSTWKITLVFFGYYAQYFLIWPLAIIIALAISVRECLALPGKIRRKKSNHDQR